MEGRPVAEGMGRLQAFWSKAACPVPIQPDQGALDRLEARGDESVSGLS
jgi:hypothetical protein